MSDATTVLNERDPDRFDRQFAIVRRGLAPFRDGVDPRISDEQLEHFEAITTGDVVDVEFILGKASAPRVSERYPEEMPALERIHAERNFKPHWIAPKPR